MGGGPEFDRIRSLIGRWGVMARGIGDDCAVVEVPAGERLVVSTDTSVEGVHFRPAWITPREVGYRAVVSAWSDLAAAAATPIGALLALSFPSRWASSLDAIADGVREAAQVAGAPIVGGDTTAGAGLVLTVTVLGSALRPLSRRGARSGDRIYVTGTLGGPGAAVRAWQRGETPGDDARARFARPTPRLREARWLAARGATAAIDVSDGLTGDLVHLAAASQAHIVIDLDRVPRITGVSPREAAASGEEYEIVVALPGAIDAAAFAREFGVPVTHVGDIVEGAPGLDVLLDGRPIDPIPGYDQVRGE